MTCIILNAHAADQKYSDRYDHIDIDAVLANSRMRNQYIHCLFGTSPCRTGSERFLKDIFAEAYVTRCNKCTEKQVYFFDSIITWFTKNEPDTLNQIVQLAIDDLRKKNA